MCAFRSKDSRDQSPFLIMIKISYCRNKKASWNSTLTQVNVNHNRTILDRLPSSIQFINFTFPENIASSLQQLFSYFFCCCLQWAHIHAYSFSTYCLIFMPTVAFSVAMAVLATRSFQYCKTLQPSTILLWIKYPMAFFAFRPQTEPYFLCGAFQYLIFYSCSVIYC